VRILHLLSSAAFHGAESMTLQLASAQRAAGDRPIVGLVDAGSNDGAIAQRFSAAGIEIRRLACRGRLDFKLVRALRALVAEEAVDVVHSHKYKTTFHALLALRGVLPVVATYHNWVLTDRALRVYAGIDKRLARWCSACVGVSADVCDELRRFVPSGRVHQVPNGIDLDHWSTAAHIAPTDFGLPQGAAAIGFVGRLSVEKGVDLLVEALARVAPQSGQAVHLLLAGEGPERAALEAQVQALGLAGRVHFAGNVADTRRVYSAVQLIVLPSLTEGLPMTALEAMACERPLVATAVGEMPTLIEAAKTGWLIERRDASELAKLLDSAMSDGARLRAMGVEARRRVAADFSAASMSAAYAGIYAGSRR
jgi:glycosyltransferase involved in cell wall biosynthesis